eukprot:CAMPEP_0198494668 /NCGR_PEP_ID=MMETSP1462-20131121/4758_1 /TAXON_ID=1333877 /ORGANISM="Brandtodinium nutriculum, Strain RCC3387" /LENGTH=75 /DNA_ID=CAMNT_0044223413 /DNA_START=30 /DNA_END=254 /DNA_ORIENTATION=-
MPDAEDSDQIASQFGLLPCALRAGKANAGISQIPGHLAACRRHGEAEGSAADLVLQHVANEHTRGAYATAGSICR